MSRFNSVEMAKTVSQYPQVEIKKSFFGLFTKAFYRPTNSPIGSYAKYFTREALEDLELLLNLNKDNCREKTSHLVLCEAVANGNLLLEMCLSNDRRFIALQLSQYHNLSYRPLSDVTYYEDETAEVIARLFNL